MEKDNSKTLLGGFETILDNFIPNAHNADGVYDENGDPIEQEYDEPIEDDELDKILADKKGNTTTEESTEESKDNSEDVKDTKTTKSTSKQTKEENKEEEVNIDSDDTEDIDNEDTDQEGSAISSLFDAISEQFGWELTEEDERPETAEELVEYIRDVIQENAIPEYASEDVAKLDEFVRNGGNIQDYYNKQTEFNLDSIDIEKESNQRAIITEFYKRKGLSDKQIEKKLNRFDDAGTLQDEAEDDLEALKEIISEEQEQLLQQQKIIAQKTKQQQQQFYTNVVNEIKGFDTMHGIKIPESDKRQLLDYIFKPDASGVTKYQKDYVKSVRNLIESAYLTMKGDVLFETAKQTGKKSAIDTFKKKLHSTTPGKKTKPVNRRSDNYDIWSSVAQQLAN